MALAEPSIENSSNLKSIMFSPGWHVRGKNEFVLVLRESRIADRLGLIVLAIGLFLFGTFLALWSSSGAKVFGLLYAAVVVMAFGAIAAFFKHQIVFDRRTGRFTYFRTPQPPVVLLTSDVKAVQVSANGLKRDVLIHLHNDMVLWLAQCVPAKAHSLAREIAEFLSVPLLKEEKDQAPGAPPSH